MLPNKTKPVRKWALVLLTLAVALSLAACGKKADKTGAATGTVGKTSEVVATYKDKDNGQITRADFDSFVNVNTLLNPQMASFASDPGFQQDMLKQLIAMKILAARADDKVKADADKQTASQLDQFKTYFGAMEGGLDKQLKDHNLTITDIENFLKMSSYGINGLKGKITDDETKKKYDDALKADPHAYDVATVSHILIALKDPSDPTGQKDLRTKDQALARAKEVKSKLDAGGDFAALAKEYSDDPGSKDQGGQYKDADINQWVPGFKEAAATQPIGKISDPVETQFGYHIIRVDDRKTKTYDEMKDSLKNDIAQQDAYDFMDKELPGLILTDKLPQPKPADQTQPSTQPGAQTGSGEQTGTQSGAQTGTQTPAQPAPAGK